MVIYKSWITPYLEIHPLSESPFFYANIRSLGCGFLALAVKVSEVLKFFQNAVCCVNNNCWGSKKSLQETILWILKCFDITNVSPDPFYILVYGFFQQFFDPE